MRLAHLVSFTKKITPPTLGFVLLLALAVSSNFSQTKEIKAKEQPSKNAGQSSVLSESESDVKEEVSDTTDDTSSSNSGNSSVNVSVSTNTTNDETTGSSNISITKDGETKNYTSDNGNFNISVQGDDGDTKVKIKSRVNISN